MPRELWAKVAVETLDDVKLFDRPDSDFRLWICLILFSKATTDDGIIRGMGPDALRRKFGLKCKTAAVEAALLHFSQTKPDPMVAFLDDGSIVLLKYRKRQVGAKDNPEAVKERQRRYRKRHVTDPLVTARNGAVTGDVTGDAPVTPPVTHPLVTGIEGDLDLDLDLDQEQEQEKREKKEQVLSSFALDPEIARASQTDATATEQAKIPHALGLDRPKSAFRKGSTGEVSDMVAEVQRVATAGAVKRGGG